jgi:predicted dehydrogenase
MTAVPLRVGIVGAGDNTKKRHIPNLQALEDVEVVAVANRSRASSEVVAGEFGIARVCETWRELVEADDLNAVVIGTWPYMHCPVTLAALEAEKHVLCEARLALDAAEARRMRDAARRRPNLVAQVVPPPLTLRVDGKVRELVNEGFLGDLLAVDARIGGGFVDRDAPLSWRHDFDLSGYNAMFLGVLYECLLRWVGEAVRVTAMTRTFVGARRDPEGALRRVRVPDHVDVVAELTGGAQAHLSVSEVTGHRSGAEIYLFGSEGTLRFADNQLFGGRRDDAELAPVEIAPEEEGGWRVEEEFVNAIRGLEPVTRTTFEDGVKYMDFTEAVARSAATGCTLALPLAPAGGL